MNPFQAPPAKQSTAELAATTLWEYQLRRENRAILEQIRKFGEQRDADVSESVKMFEEVEKRRLTLEAQVGEIKKEQILKDSRAAEHEKECAAKMAEMEKFIRSRLSEEEFNKMMSDAVSKLPAQPAIDSPQSSRSRTHPSNQNQRSGVEAQEVRQQAVTNKTNAPSRDNGRPIRPMKVANRRPATRSTSSGGNAPVQQADPVMAAPARSTSSPVMTAPPTLPKLVQKHRTLKQYYDQANSIFQSINMKDPQMEYDFINAFINGLDTKKARDKLIRALQAVHPSNTRPDGGVQIRCDWEDIPAGFKRAGLDITGAQEEIKRKKRTLNPRTQLETGFASQFN